MTMEISPYHPCSKNVRHKMVEVVSNEYGTLQLHPCGVPWCRTVYVFSVDKDDYVDFEREDPTWQRLQTAMQEAAQKGEPGFRPSSELVSL